MSINDVVTITPTIIESLVIRGDLSGLNPQEKVVYYKARCAHLGIDPSEQPFQLLRLNGREVLYATKACTDALCRSRQLRREVTSRDRIEDVYVVTCRCSDANGRYDEATGAVNIAGLQGEALANALMKSETKAKRRAVLSLCGLGMLDESEIETIQGAQSVPIVLPVQIENELEVADKSTAVVKSALTPKREAWLFRAAQEANLPKEVLGRCLEYLRSATPEVVKGFFDDLAKRKPVFQPFTVTAA